MEHHPKYSTVGLLRAALAFAAVLGIASASQAHAGEAQSCGSFGSWSWHCDIGFDCDVRWDFGGLKLGVCVDNSPTTCGGILGRLCSQGDFCDYAPDANCGRADMTGTCRTQPEICTKEYRPVCGCDGQTYGNACEANAHGVSVEFEGPCRPENECIEDTDCPHGACDHGVTCLAIGCPPPPPNRCLVCGDGSELRCRMALMPCPDGQVREIVDGCYGECVDRYSCEPVEPETCEYDGELYEVGETFPASDGCNECTCGEDGRVGCTEKACACNNPNRSYVSRDQDRCAAIRFLCVEGTRPFSDECGCGCEPDDCRTDGCGDGSFCSNCWGSFQCIPDGAMC